MYARRSHASIRCLLCSGPFLNPIPMPAYGCRPKWGRWRIMSARSSFSPSRPRNVSDTWSCARSVLMPLLALVPVKNYLVVSSHRRLASFTPLTPPRRTAGSAVCALSPCRVCPCPFAVSSHAGLRARSPCRHAALTLSLSLHRSLPAYSGAAPPAVHPRPPKCPSLRYDHSDTVLSDAIFAPDSRPGRIHSIAQNLIVPNVESYYS